MAPQSGRNLYAADMAVWLWTTLFRGEPSRTYNVGSEHGLGTGALAHTMATRLGVPGTNRQSARGRPGGSSLRAVHPTSAGRVGLDGANLSR